MLSDVVNSSKTSFSTIFLSGIIHTNFFVGPIFASFLHGPVGHSLRAGLTLFLSDFSLAFLLSFS